MRSTSVAVLLLLALAGSAIAQSCDNPFHQFVEEEVPFLSSPEDPGAGMSEACPALESVCCPDAVGAYMVDALDEVYAEVESGYDEIVNAVDQLDDQRDAYIARWEGYRDEVAVSIPNVDAAVNTAFNTFWESLIDLMIELFVALWDHIVNFILEYAYAARGCIYGYIKYLAGVWCFLCDGNWAEYVVEDETLIKLEVARSTCEDIVTDCQPMYFKFREFAVNVTSDVLVFANGVSDAVNQLEADLTEVYPQLAQEIGEYGDEFDSLAGELEDELINYTTDTTVCGGDQDCADVICDDLSGFEFVEPEPPISVELGDDGVNIGGYRMAPLARFIERPARMHITASTQGAAKTMYHIMRAQYLMMSKSELKIEDVRDVLVPELKLAVSATSDAQARYRSARQSGEADVQNEYTDNGVDLYANGEESGVYAQSEAAIAELSECEENPELAFCASSRVTVGAVAVLAAAVALLA